MKKTLTIIVSIILTASISRGQEVTVEQQQELLGIGLQYAQATSLYEGMVQGKLVELALELTRDGRLESEEAAKESAERANVILKDIGGLYGDFVKMRVAFMLEVKNALTLEQKLHMLANLEPGTLIDFDEIAFLQPGIFDLPINLNLDQHRKLIKLEADMLIEEVKIERDVELALLELEAIFMGESIKPADVDKQVMKLANLAADAIENRVDWILGAKDVLTLDQKRLLTYLIGL